jgi:hypothetical protein
VEFWSSGEKAEEISKPVPPKAGKLTHSKRADRLGWALAVVATAIVALLITCLILWKKNEDQQIASASKPVSPVVDFYRGNRVFDAKFKKEKAHAESSRDVTSASGEDLEVSLQDQMSSMHDKLEKMRLEKTKEEPPVQAPDRGAIPDQLMQVSPVDVSNNFTSPTEFLQNLPKSLQQESSETR